MLYCTELKQLACSVLTSLCQHAVSIKSTKHEVNSACNWLCFFSICWAADRDDRPDGRPDLRWHSVPRLPYIRYENIVSKHWWSRGAAVGTPGASAQGEGTSAVWPAHNEQNVSAALHSYTWKQQIFLNERQVRCLSYRYGVCQETGTVSVMRTLFLCCLKYFSGHVQLESCPNSHIHSIFYKLLLP